MNPDSNEYFRRAIAAALLAPDPGSASAVLHAIPAHRLAIHRNNVHCALGDALGEAYPAVRRLVGEEFFAATARAFFACTPVRHASLALCGHGFAQFLASFAPAAGIAYLADVARLERAWLESLHAADAAVLEAAILSGPVEQLPNLRFSAHPATRLVLSTHPMVSIWQQNRDPSRPVSDPVEIDDRVEHALVTRPHLDVQVQIVDTPAAVFAQALLDGHHVSTAWQRAVGEGELDVAAIFSNLLLAGAFSKTL